MSVRGVIMFLLDVHNMALSEKYLGMPTNVRSSANGAFKYLKDRDWNTRVDGADPVRWWQVLVFLNATTRQRLLALASR